MKEPWREKPEWQALREQGRRVIAHQHVHTDECNASNCMDVRDKEWAMRVRALDIAGMKLDYNPSTFEWKAVPK